MHHTEKLFLIAAAMLVSVLGGPIAVAGASDASIKALIKTHEAKIVADEGKLVTAIGEFKTSGNPAAVVAADKVVVSDLRTLVSKLEKESASSTNVREGKKKFDKGLSTIAVAYRRLGKAFEEKASSPSSAVAEAQKSLKTVKKGRKELKAGVKLLNS